MKPIIATIIGLWLAAVAFGGENDRLWRAVCKVESNHNPRAIGDGGRAAGIAQIHPCVVSDCNQVVGYRKFTLADRFNPVKSRQMFDIYLARYARGKGDFKKAEIWNSGPRGRSPGYAKKVMRAMGGAR